MNNYYHYWGKASQKTDDTSDYHLLIYHCLDVAAVGRVYIENNGPYRKKFSSLLNMPEEKFTSWIIFLLMIHDIGKFSFSFQGLRKDIQSRISGENNTRSYDVRHDNLGYAFFNEQYKNLELFDKITIDESLIKDEFFENIFLLYLSGFSLGHHGKPASLQQGSLRRINVKKIFYWK